MSIKLKLALFSLLLSLMLASVALVVMTSFDDLRAGFTAVSNNASAGSANANKSTQELIKVDAQLKSSVESMQGLMDGVKSTNNGVKVVHRKIKNIYESLGDILSDIEESSTQVPEGDALYALEDAIDSIDDVRESLRREAFVYLDKTATNLAVYSEKIAADSSNVASASSELGRVKALSSDTAQTNEAIKDKAEAFDKNIGTLNNSLLTAILVVIAISIAGLALLARSILGPLTQAYKLACRIADGERDLTVSNARNDEIGRLFQPLSALIDKMQSDMQEAEQRAIEGARIRRALDNSASAVLMTNTDDNVIYMNGSAESLFNMLNHDNAIDLSAMFGQKLTDFFPSLANEATLASEDANSREILITLHERKFRIVSSPVFDDSDNRIGTAQEWSDQTTEIEIRHEVERIVDAAQKGDLSQRIAVEHFSLDPRNQFFANLGSSINQFIDKVDGVVKEIEAVTSAMARGDLTQQVTQSYQGSFADLKKNVNASLQNLAQIVSSVRGLSTGLKSTADEIASGNTSLSNRTEKQAESLIQTSATLEQLTGGIASNTENAKAANQLATSAKQRADQDREVVVQATQAMQSISEASSKIGDIIGVINELAFQTNLLALNASVEAARAGEQGRGFAVVAAEVRTLAERSACSAREIGDLIEDSFQKVELGTKLVNASGETTAELIETVNKLGDLVDGITCATIEQATGTDQIYQIVNQMEKITQQNAALADRTSEDARGMHGKTEELNNIIAEFKLA